MKGVEDSEAEPKVAARDMSLLLPLREEMCLKKKELENLLGIPWVLLPSLLSVDSSTREKMKRKGRARRMP